MKAALLVFTLAACIDRPPAAPDAAHDGSVPVACDGGLCATDNGSTCSAAQADPSMLVGLLVAIAVIARRRKP